MKVRVSVAVLCIGVTICSTAGCRSGGNDAEAVETLTKVKTARDAALAKALQIVGSGG